MLMIHTALHAEALALINHFHLERERSLQAFACFTNKNIFLIESGMGKTHTAAAVAWASAITNNNAPVWLNIGMAGHISYPVGACIGIDMIEDGLTGQQTSLSAPTIPELKIDSLLTISEPTTNYPENNLVDMETSAFVSTARRFTSLELIHSIKVISDNTDNPAQRLKAKAVESLFNPQINIIEQLMQQLEIRRGKLLEKANSD